MKKGPSVKKISDLADQFIKRVDGQLFGVLFDQNLETSLKRNTRKKREGSKRVAFSIHDEMNISKISLKELLSDSSTKANFTRYLSKKLLRRCSENNIVVSYDTHTEEHNIVVSYDIHTEENNIVVSYDTHTEENNIVVSYDTHTEEK